jgi:hypothetical protein
MPIRCGMCGFSDFRVSRFRKADIAHLFLLQFPVRCRACQRRDFAFVWQIPKIRQDAKLRHTKAAEDKKTKTR